ncbi:hypothetical protein vseg_005412 [Gypsophila vaccaria]
MAFNISDDDNSKLVPRFFKIILDPHDGLHQMGIPRQFMTENGSHLPDEVSLVIPTGKTWKVELARDESGRAWFKDGWQEFVKYNSLSRGHLLVFSYAHRSRFNVNVFDKSACEAQYRVDEAQERKTFEKKKCETKGEKVKCGAEKGMAALVRHYKSKFGGITPADIKLINSYQNYENPSFAVILQPSYVEYKFCLNVPSQFAAEYGITKGRFTLENPNGDKWTVNCIGATPNSKKILGGWKEYAFDNNLQVGDVCVFQLMKFAHHLFKVDIIRFANVDRRQWK